MIKEFEKLVGKYEVQLNFTELQSPKTEGIRVKIIFIPLEKDLPALIPVHAWGKPENVMNSIRYELDNLSILIDLEDDAKNHEEYLKKEEVDKVGVVIKDDGKTEEISKIGTTPLDLATEKLMQEADQEKELKIIKSRVIERTGIPKDNIIVAKPKSLPNVKELTEVESKLRDKMMESEKETPEACMVCGVDMDTVNKNEKKSCQYKDCPHGKFTDPYQALNKPPKDTDNYMIEEELRKNPPPVKLGTLEDAFDKPKDSKDPASGYIEEQLDNEMPDWMKMEMEENDKKANENNQSTFQF